MVRARLRAGFRAARIGGPAEGGCGVRPLYSHPWRRASRIASMRLRVPVFPMAEER